MTTAEEIAVEHGTLAREGDGWTTGAMANCAIQKRARESRGPRDKISVPAYAAKSGIGEDTLLRILTAWESQANLGLVPHAADIGPADLPQVIAALPSEAEHPWKDAYKGLSRHTADDRLTRVANSDAGALVGQMRPKQRTAIITEIARKQPDAVVQAVKADPEVADELQRGAGPELFDAGNRVRAEKIFNHEAQAIANGGRIPSLDEINGPAPGEGGYNQFIPVINRLHDAERLVDKAYTLIVEARQIMPLTESMEKQVQAMALHILESLDKEQAE